MNVDPCGSGSAALIFNKRSINFLLGVVVIAGWIVSVWCPRGMTVVHLIGEVKGTD